MERLDKIISSRSTYSRKEIKQLITNGLVMVDGLVALDPARKYDADSISVSIQGKLLSPARHIYLMLNKPQGIISASKDPKAKTVVDLVPKDYQRKGLFPAGRLDSDTIGFVLLTDDGDFAHRILSPKSHVPKTYEVTLDEMVDPSVTRLFQEGMILQNGEHCKPATLQILDKRENLVEVVLTEGKYHQIKRMFAAVNRKITLLKRTKIGGLRLDESLLFGECREISPSELEEMTKI